MLVTGGLDSAVVAALVASQTGEPPLLLAARGGLASAIEIELQGRLAVHLGAELQVVKDIPPFTVGPLLARNSVSDFPSGGVFTHIWDFIADAARSAGADIVFTGEGGNEVFSPGLALAYDQIREGAFAAAIGTFGRTRDSDGSSALTRLFRGPARAMLPQMHEGAGQQSAVRAWRGRHADGRMSAAQRRNAQFRRLRAGGKSYSQIDAALSLERNDLFHAHSSAVDVGFHAPLLSSAVRTAVLAFPPKWRNPVKVGFQDKYLLRLVGRAVLPEEITEVRKIGISNQIAVVLRGADLTNEIARLEPGAQWAGLRLDEAFAQPERQPANLGLDWTRLLAISAWATAGLARTE